VRKRREQIGKPKGVGHSRERFQEGKAKKRGKRTSRKGYLHVEVSSPPGVTGFQKQGKKQLLKTASRKLKKKKGLGEDEAMYVCRGRGVGHCRSAWDPKVTRHCRPWNLKDESRMMKKKECTLGNWSKGAEKKPSTGKSREGKGVHTPNLPLNKPDEAD